MQRSCQGLVVVAALSAAVASGTWMFSSVSSRSAVPLEITAKLAGLRRAIPVPYGAPGQAQRHFNAKRLPADQTINTRDAYARAERHARGMPMYSVAAGRNLSASEGRAARDGRSVLRGSWKPLGPGNVGGRTRTLVIDPDRPSVMYAGGVSGGVWKTTSGGELDGDEPRRP